VGRLQDDIKQTQPFASISVEVHLNMVRTVDAVERRFVDLLRVSSLSSTQYNVLRILRGAGEDGLHTMQIAERMITRDPDITRLLDRLEKRELISRCRVSHDRRCVKAHITPAGLGLLAELEEPLMALHRETFKHMSDESLQTLNTLLEELRGPLA